MAEEISYLDTDRNDRPKQDVVIERYSGVAWPGGRFRNVES